MGIVRIALENDLHIVPRELADLAFAAYAEQGRGRARGPPARRDRGLHLGAPQGLLLDEGLPFPLVEAAVGAAPRSGRGGGWPPRRPPPPVAARRPAARRGSGARLRPARTRTVLQRRGRGLHAPGRACRQGRGEPGGVPAEPDPARFSDEAEHALAAALAEVRGPLAAALAGGDVEAALLAAATLRAPVDRYFDDVLVMDKDPAVRGNRLAQLTQITALLGSLGDFSRLPVQQG